ncbi:MAG TPA: hypothetical protein VGK74_20160 [Symbiobacteriaceae bacterium]|jgi:hypothetical protein
MNNSSPVISFSAAEAAYLAALLGAETLVGFPDPFYGWLAEDIRTALLETRAGLAGRGLVTLGPEGSTAIDPAVAPLIRACGFADASFVLTRTDPAGTTAVRYYHVAPELTVEHVTPPHSLSAGDLAGVAGTYEVYRRVLAFFRLEGQIAPAADSGLLPEALLRRARTLAESNEGEARAVLLQAGLSTSVARALAETFLHPVGNAALVALARRADAPEVDGVAFLAGANGIWRLRPTSRHGADWVELSPFTAAEAESGILRVMNRVLPVPLGVH